MNTNGDHRETAQSGVTVLRAGRAALCMQADQVMAQVVVALRESLPTKAAQGLTELAGALALAGEQGLAALVERLHHVVLATGGLDSMDAAALPERARRLRAELRCGLECSLRGEALQAADLLPAWQAMSGTDDAMPADDAAPLLSLQTDERFELEMPAAVTAPLPVDPIAAAEHALLGFLRAADSIERCEAAQVLAPVLAGVAAEADLLATRRLWLVLHAYVDELAAGNFAGSARTKHILAHMLRALRHRADPLLAAELAPLARQALFELAQSPPLSVAARQVVRAYDLERQVSSPPSRRAGAWTASLDMADEQFIAQLASWIAARDAGADGLGSVDGWHALVEPARRSEHFSSLAEPLGRMAESWSAQAAPDVDECVAAAMLCLHLRATARPGTGMEAIRMTELLELAAVNPPAAKPALQATARRLGAQSLLCSLAAACADVLDAGERLLDGSLARQDNAHVADDVRRLLEAMTGAARLLALDSVLPLAEALLDQLDDFLVASARGDDVRLQAFARTWVMLADEIAMLPWTANWQEDPTNEPYPQGERLLPEAPGADFSREVSCEVPCEAPLNDPLLTIFFEEAAGLLAQLRAALLPIAGERRPAAWADALHAAHTLAGCAATVGLPAMGRLAQELESLLECASPASSLFDDPAMAGEVLETLEAMIAEFAETGTCRDADLLVARLHDGTSRWDGGDEHRQASAVLPPAVAMPDCSPAEDGSEVSAEAVGSLTADDAMTVDHAADAAADASDVVAHVAGDGTEPAAIEASDNDQTAPTAYPDDTLRPAASEDDELLAIFREEAADLLPQLEQALHAWQQSPDDRAAPAPLLRILHTLKGSARMAGQLAWGDALHRCESEVGMIGSLAPSAVGERLIALQALIDEWQRAWCSPPESLPAAVSPRIVEPLDPLAAMDPAVNGSQVHAPADDMPAGLPAPQQMAVRTSSASLLRVRAEVFSNFAEAVAELWVGHARVTDGVQQQRRAVADLADILARLRAQVRELEIDAESRIVSVATPCDDTGFDPLEFDRYTRLHEITRMIAESAADLGDLQRSLMRQGDGLARAADAQVRELRGLQSSLQAVRSQPFGAIETRLRHVTRQAARESGREVECELIGSSVEVDRALLDRLAGPLEHVLRNAVVHGVEPPADRAAKGKPRAGRISLSALSSAAELRIELADDGGGLNLERIRDRALAVGLLAPQDDPEPHILADLIFRPGFSTASEVTALAGRGIGLDAVRSELQALGGRISVESRAGEGCCFTIAVPLSLATLPVLLVRAGRHRIGLPAPHLQQLLQLKPGDPGHDAGSCTLPWEGTTVPLADLGHLLGEPSQPVKPDARVPVAILGDSGRRLALRLDAVEGQRELVVKSPGPQLSRVPGLSGASVLGDGSIALIIDPFRLGTLDTLDSLDAMDTHGRRSGRAPLAPTTPSAGPLVLVVDDSLTVRRASQRLLERHGYEVALARDGIEALALMRERRPGAVLLDIEMPRMDGFELLAAVREDPQLRDLTVVMITSRIADRHRQRAQQLGASAYMGKPFREEELVSLLAGLCRSTSGEPDEGRMEKQPRSERSEATA